MENQAPAIPIAPDLGYNRAVTEQPMIDFKRVSVIYPTGLCALQEVDLRINKGEFVFLVGKSGQGKSTTLKLISRELKPAAGLVLVEGHDIGHLSAHGVARLRRRIGVVFQDFRLLEYKTVRENLKFAMQVVDTPPQIIRRRVNDLLEQVGLADRRNAFPQQLSGGEQQRLCIARALINHPPILLADEPTGNLDPDSSLEIIRLLEAIHLKGATVVMATHDRAIVDTLRKRVVYFCGGRIISDAPEGSYYPACECMPEDALPTDDPTCAAPTF
jgi:cell division transport system ATP-binding protein